MSVGSRDRSDPFEPRGQRVTVMGLGLFGGGAGAAAWFADAGARVTVTDLRPPEVLAPAIAGLGDRPIRYRLGEHDPSDFEEAEVVVVNPAVRLDAPLLAKARRAGALLTTELGLGLARCRGRIHAVTGSVGKTTTAHLVAAALRAAGRDPVLAGNVGGGLLAVADGIESQRPVVLEISSFQIEALAALGAPGLPPHPFASACVTNCVPNHLDRHGDFRAYVAAKRIALGLVAPGGVIVLNGDDPEVVGWPAGEGRARRTFSIAGATEADARLEEGALVFGRGPAGIAVLAAGAMPLPGLFNRANALAAGLVALEAGAGPEALADAFRAFEGVAHRMERVPSADGITWIDNSKATTPTAAAAAVEALDGPLLVLVGGQDRDLPYAPLPEVIRRQNARVVAFGAATARVRRALGDAVVAEGGGLAEAVAEARRLARPGETVLLAPAAPSFDEFPNYEARGRRFREAVAAGAPAACRTGG